MVLADRRWSGLVVAGSVSGGPARSGVLVVPASLWPDATNTGYQNAPGYPGSLTSMSGAYTNFTSGQTYSFRDFAWADVGNPGANARDNVTFVGCRFKGPARGEGLVKVWGDNVKFRYCTWEPNDSGPPTAITNSYQYGIVSSGSYSTHANNLTVEYCNFRGFGNAIDIQGSGHLFQHNWFHDASNDNGGEYHTDGIGMTNTGGSVTSTVIHHNNFDTAGNTNGLAFQEGTYDAITITDNLFTGFGYTVALWGTSTNVTFTGNAFSTKLKPVFGPLYPQTFWTGSGRLWANNRWLHPADASWGNPAHDGLYWIPTVGVISGDNSAPFVSATDYAG